MKAILLLVATTTSLPALAVVDAGPSNVVSLKELRESGVVIQQWDASCAAAAIATVLTYTFNDAVSERAVVEGLLRQTEPLKVRHRGGFSMLDMVRFADERGYGALGFREMTLEDMRFLDAPIVPVQFHGFNHYVVFKGLDSNGRVRLADPAFGNRTIDRDRFEDAWVDGIALVLHRRS